MGGTFAQERPVAIRLLQNFSWTFCKRALGLVPVWSILARDHVSARFAYRVL
jgi:hypothetical protein